MPFCPCDGRQTGLLYLPARWRDTTKDHRVYSQQFQAELVRLFREYGVETFEGMYGKE